MTNPYNPYVAGARVQESAREWNKLQLGALGIGVTFIAVACTALSAFSMWWSDRGSTQADGKSEQVTVTTNSGSACTRLASTHAVPAAATSPSSSSRCPDWR